MKVNSETLLFNWQLECDLILRKVMKNGAKASCKMSTSICRMHSRDLRSFRPKPVYDEEIVFFYSFEPAVRQYLKDLENKICSEGENLNPLGSEIRGQNYRILFQK